MLGNVQVHPNMRKNTVVRTTPAMRIAMMVMKDASEFHVEDFASNMGPLYNSEVEGVNVLDPPSLRARAVKA